MSLINSKHVAVDTLAFTTGAGGTAVSSALTGNMGSNPISDAAMPIIVGFITGIVFPFIKELTSDWLKRRRERRKDKYKI